jgi:hypothetical protein
MFNLYFGKLNKHIKLDNGYILSAKLKTEVETPLSLEIIIDIDELYRIEGNVMTEYFINYNSDFFLDIDLDDLGYRFIKKHNQADKIVMVGKNGDKYLLVNGSERLKNTNYTFDSEFIKTVDGNSLVVTQHNVLNDEPTYDTRVINSMTSSQNMLNEIIYEEVSITGQELEDNTLKITLFSGLYALNQMKCELTYGFKYKDRLLSSMLAEFLPNVQFNIDPLVDLPLSYTCEVKTNLEILKDLTIGTSFIDDGYDYSTNTQKVKVYKAKNQNPEIRILSIPNNQKMPFMFSVTEKYPTISAKLDLNQNYIREGTKCLVDYVNRHTRYRGEFFIKGITIDLLYLNSEAGTVQFLKTDRDVRKSYLEQNLETLASRLI